MVGIEVGIASWVIILIVPYSRWTGHYATTQFTPKPDSLKRAPTRPEDVFDAGGSQLAAMPSSAMAVEAARYTTAWRKPAIVCSSRASAAEPVAQRLHEQCDRAIAGLADQNPNRLPSADTAVMMFAALPASDRSACARFDGWQTLALFPSVVSRLGTPLHPAFENNWAPTYAIVE